MPSGDAGAAAVFCLLYAVLLHLPGVYVILPLVCMGRVYYQCHWFGDTFVGVFVGTFWAISTLFVFDQMVPLLQWISGPGTFTLPVHKAFL